MSSLFRFLVTVAAAVSISACGGGGDVASSGGSGLGGTGISFARGNIASIDGQPAPGPGKPLGVFAKVRVTVGGQSVEINANGGFALSGVQPGNNMSMMFTIPDRGTAALPIGGLGPDMTVIVPDVKIDTATGTATSGPIQFINEMSGSSGGGGSSGAAGTAGNGGSGGNSGSGNNETAGTNGNGVTGALGGATGTATGVVEGVVGTGTDTVDGLMNDGGI